MRKKALTKKISKEELSWVLLNCNQKRGYYQLRDEEEEANTGKLVEFHTLIVTDIIDTGERNKAGQTLYSVILENGWSFIKPSKNPIDWKGKVKEFITTTDVEDDGSTPKKDKEGKDKRSFRSVDSEKDWLAVKKKTEQDIDTSNKTVGCFIYDSLLKNPNQKIKGKLVRTVERCYYKKELTAILKTQITHHPELMNREVYGSCINELYPNNDAHRSNIKERGFDYLFIEDILFYQRPLKSKISLISDCPFEENTFIKDGKTVSKPLKCIAKSHPLFQEFRLWQFVANLKIYQRESSEAGVYRMDIDVTHKFLSSEEDYTDLFDLLNDRENITQKQFLALPKFKLKEDAFRWNMVEDKPYPCNETRSVFLNKGSKLSIDKTFFDQKTTEALWHISIL